jgi:hypothetical protein
MSPLPEATGHVYTDHEESVQQYFFEAPIKPTDVIVKPGGVKRRMAELGIDSLDTGFIEETWVDHRGTVMNRIRVYPTNRPGVYASVEWDPYTYEDTDGRRPVFRAELSRSSLYRLGVEVDRNYREMLTQLPIPNIVPSLLQSMADHYKG